MFPSLASLRRLGWFVLALLVLLPVFLSPHWALPGTTYAYLFVLDVSESMNVRDAPGRSPRAAEAVDGRERRPDGQTEESRLDRAKASTVAALGALPCGSRVSVGLFAGSDALTLFEPMEICRHYPGIEAVVRGIDWRMAWDGDSRIEAGVRAALTEARQRGLDLVFFSDGDEAPHVGVPHMADLLAVQGKVKGLLVGIGGTQPRPVPRLDADNRVVGYWTAVDAVREGFYPNLAEIVKQSPAPAELERSGALDEVQEHKSALNEEYLQLVGASAGLAYVRADSAPQVGAVVAGAANARHEKADRDMRLVFGLASALFVTLGWVQRRNVGDEGRAMMGARQVARA